MRKLLLGTVSLLLAATSPHAQAAARSGPGLSGSCVGFDFPVDEKTGEGDYSAALIVLRNGVRLYADATGAVELNQRLNFNDRLTLKRVSNDRSRGRVEVMQRGRTNSLGWVSRKHVLCAKHPLIGDEEIERKIYVRTKTYLHGEEPTHAAVYPTPDSDDCGGPCREVSRFELFYIVAESDRRFLISSEWDPREGSLMGWLNKEDGIQWNTAIGLRPRGDATIYVAASEGCRAVASAESDRAIGIAGGKQWYAKADRLPVLSLQHDGGRECYTVAAPAVGTTVVVDHDRDLAAATARLRQLKNLDVFFLLDGTSSMGPYIQQAKRAAIAISERLAGDARYAQTKFRFGYRVYRDTYRGSKPVGEGLPLSRSCNGTRKDNSLQELVRQLNGYRATKGDKGDAPPYYPEALFAGLRQAASDMEACEQHMKLLFVIGDAGDNQPAVPAKLPATIGKAGRTIVPFFIRTRRRTDVKHQTLYDQAFERFEKQAMTILDGLLPPTAFDGKTTVDRREFWHPLGRASLSDDIADRVARFARPEEIEQVVLALETGEGLQGYIQKRIGERELPVLFWDAVGREACKELRTQCTERVDHRVMEIKLPATDAWVEEVMISDTKLRRWIELLGLLNKDMGDRTSTERSALVTQMTHTLEKYLGKPAIEETGEKIGEYMQRRGGLPTRRDGPLMQYEMIELGTIPPCELKRLLGWMKVSRRALQDVKSRPTHLVRMEYLPWGSKDCIDITAKGRAIPAARLAPDAEALGPNRSYSYKKLVHNKYRYWLPAEFLP